jgi:hypothetical protein
MEYAEWGFVPYVVRDLFEDPSPAAVAASLDEFCRQALGSGIERSEFFEASVSSVHGLRLLDGRRVVVKLHGPGVSTAFLEAVQAVQRHLVTGAYPAPEPLLAPTPLGRGTAVVESYLDRGERGDAHDPDVRRALAVGLADLVERCRPLVDLAGLREHPMATDATRLWPVPHDGRFDFEATSAGAEWIDQIAAEAKPIREREVGDLVVGHYDWRVEHVRFEDGRVSAVYDWDSLSIGREPALVGSVAHAFTSNWTKSDWMQFPTLEEALAFVSEYENARGTPFDDAERAVVRGSLAYTMAYTARCEHSDALTEMGQSEPASARAAVPPLTARAFLGAHAAELLGRA